MIDFVKKLFDEPLDLIVEARILPSVVFAQLSLESDFGNSELAKNASNYFGIKVGSGWTGEVYQKITKEQTKEGVSYDVLADFRKYDSLTDCVGDLLHKYTHGTGWEQHNRYADLIGETDYKKACFTLVENGYATDIKYAEKLIRIIEEYELYKLDPVPNNNEEEKDLAVTWVIDAGHGGVDPGASANGVIEKNWNLEASLYISKRLRVHGIKVVETRTSDKGIDSTTRGNLLKNSGAKKGLSLHFNAAGVSARGFEFIHSIYSDGKFENILKTKFMAGSIPFRRIFTRKNDAGGDYYFVHRLSGNVRMTLVEFGFLTNKADVQALDTRAEREKYYEYVVDAVCTEEKIAYKKVNAPAPAKPVAPAPAPAKSRGVYRFFENGKQVGAYSDPRKAFDEAVKRGVKDIRIELI